jgi:acyl carrier protein
MSDTDIRAVVVEELSNIAPDVDMSTIDPSADLREALDIDSMDFLNFITGLEEGAGVRIPEPDYAKVSSLSSAVDYLERAPHLASS